ncbi:phage baseplate assembly protein domain-containing protein [Acinetobacter chinensis]|jgi:phage gp45-like|uniref:phage baseplate assembly protein domain-containing protein n=1 Tax=Acinetobacter chinensis TaxID=2004650 RepID=UPI00293444ED|nr:phage baseplate assembly protein [Acinetobacter chinensis]WOE42398.1 phage baseplate assembly protein [Acinetobacter chinensis]
MIGSVQRQIARGIGQVRQSFLGVVARGGSKLLQLTGLADEVLDEVELIQHVGFSSHIPEGSRVVIIPLQGKTSRSIVIATDGAPIVINVSEGETCIYDQYGHSIWLKKDGTHIKGNLYVEDGDVFVTDGSVTAAEDVSDKTSSMQGMRDVYNVHNNGNTPPPNQKM